MQQARLLYWGKVPYGFQLKETVIDGIRTKMYEPIPEETEIVQTIFRMYAEPQTSFDDIVRYLDEQQVKKEMEPLFLAVESVMR